LQRRIILLKVGSSSLTLPSSVEPKSIKEILNERVFELVSLIATFLEKESNFQVVLVTSGAVAAGLRTLDLNPPLKSPSLRRAAASIGQPLLMKAYQEAFTKLNRRCAQILLTRRDLTERDSFLNALDTITTLLNYNVTPIINENDTLTLAADSFGNNDHLSSIVAAFLHAESLILFTDVEAVFSSNPKVDTEAKRYKILDEIPPHLLSPETSKGQTGLVGTGGMSAKLSAVASALQFGVRCYIGRISDVQDLKEVVAGRGPGTYFNAISDGKQSRKDQWLSLHAKAKGVLVIDDGAKAAIFERGSSLLPVGVCQIKGSFEVGDVVLIESIDGVTLGKGVSRFSSDQLEFLVTTRGNSKRGNEAIHRDYLVLF
jgi:glutamate 5-kinase